MAADPTRRALLAATAALPLLVAGCKGTEALGKPPGPPPDVTRLRAVMAAEDELIARYQAVVRLAAGGQYVGPATSRVLAQVLAEHQAHLRRLRASLIPGSPQAAGSGPLPRPSVPAPPSSGAQAVGELAAAERAASSRLLAQVAQAPPALAQLLASIGAAEATHAAALHRAARP